MGDERLTVVQLKAALKSLGLSTSGLKAVLQERLRAARSTEAPSASAPRDEVEAPVVVDAPSLDPDTQQACASAQAHEGLSKRQSLSQELPKDRPAVAADVQPTDVLDDAAVSHAYASLGGGLRPPLAQRAAALESEQFLESLWLHWSPAASRAHTMSLLCLWHEKCKNGICLWDFFAAVQPRFAGLVHVVAALTTDAALTVVERTLCVTFWIHLTLSLENESVRMLVLPIVSLPLWHALSPGRLQLELARNATLEKHWRHAQRKEAKAAKQAGHTPVSATVSATFLPSLVDLFVNTARDAVGGDGGADAHTLALLERCLELFVDLLSQLPTRRFVRTVLDDRAVLVKCRLSSLCSHPQGRLFVQLVDLLRACFAVPVDDHTGQPLSDDEVGAAHYERLMALQRLAFKHIPALRELALSSCGALEKRAALVRHFGALPPDALLRLATRQLRLASPDDTWAAADPRFVLEVLVSAFEERQSQRRAIAEMPLYPNEEVLWDENLVPSASYAGEGAWDKTFALPKLNLQFLTFHDYLLRNFNLFRLEATYEIREDIGDAMARVSPVRHPDREGGVAFAGWARSAVPPLSVAITDVRKPVVGESRPAAVHAEIRVDLASLRPDVRAEWDALRQHDILFLLTVALPHVAAPAHGSAAQRAGLRCVRGCELVELRDAEGRVMGESAQGRARESAPPRGTQRTLVVALDTAQYQLDVNQQGGGSADAYTGANLVVRRKPEENNFKAILECIRDLMSEREAAVPEWLHDTFLGYGDPAAASWTNLPSAIHTLDFKDTFLDAAHLRASFPGRSVVFTDASGPAPSPPFRITFPELVDSAARASQIRGKRKAGAEPGDDSPPLRPLLVQAYTPPSPGPYPEDQPQQNRVRFTPTQVAAVVSGLQPGLTLLIGPPGTGKTDTAVQILHTLYHNFPKQRTLVITHSNAALNDLFSKLAERDVPARYMLRLGAGEAQLGGDTDYSRSGRVNAMLSRRIQLLAEVERLARSLGVPDDVAYTCETAAHFWLLHVLSRWEAFAALVARSGDADPALVAARFPFSEFFKTAPQPLFRGDDVGGDMRVAQGCFQHLRVVFNELEECRAFELLKGTVERGNYLLTRQALVVAMTCTHAALKRRDFVRLGFKFDNLLMEEAAQILEIETFIPMLLQATEDGVSRLKRVALLGDHHQLPPVVKNLAFQKFSHLDQSLFTRFVRLGVPALQLNAQGRARPSLAKLYSWRYSGLDDLPCVFDGAYACANAGFAHETQWVDVPDLDGRGETEPTPHFIQNLAEAEFVVSVYQYMRLLGYPAQRISLLATYQGQKALLRDVVARRCAQHPLFGSPAAISTVDQYQGQQNDYVLLSLVRTRNVGHLRDVRRLVVAMSRARLGLYVFGREALFRQCAELQPALSQLFSFPTRLAIVPGEHHPTARGTSDAVAAQLVAGVAAMGALVNALVTKWQQEAASSIQQMTT